MGNRFTPLFGTNNAAPAPASSAKKLPSLSPSPVTASIQNNKPPSFFRVGKQLLPPLTTSSPSTTNTKDSKSPSSATTGSNAHTDTASPFPPALALPPPVRPEEYFWKAIQSTNLQDINEILKFSPRKIELVTKRITKEFNAEHEGENALTLAAKLKKYQIVSAIINAVSDSTECTNKDGDTALHIAVRNQDLPTTVTLITKGADCKKPNDANVDPHQLACKLYMQARDETEQKQTEQIRNLIIKHEYDDPRVQYNTIFVTRAERSKQVQKLQATHVNATNYLMRVYVVDDETAQHQVPGFKS